MNPSLFPPWANVPSPNTKNTKQCDVAIVGGTFPALWLAATLRASGFSVVVVEQRSCVGAAQELRQLGMIQLGLLDNFWRISKGMGEEQAFEIARASLRGIALIKSLVSTRSEGWMLARDERERKELEKLLILYQKWGVDASWIKKSRVKEYIPSDVMHGGVRVGEEACVHPEDLAQILLLQSIEAGVDLIFDANLHRIEDRVGGSRLFHRQGTTDAEVVVYMQHDALSKIEPFFTTTMGTVRTQAISYVRSSPLMKQSCTAQYGYLSWRDKGHMRMISGCRWATPHLEVGENDDSVVVPSIEKALIKTVQQCFLEEEVRISNRWSMIEHRSCDGVPLVGSIPGRDHLVACTAFHGRLLGLGFAAAESVSELLLQGEAKHLPSSFSSRRFLT